MKNILTALALSALTLSSSCATAYPDTEPHNSPALSECRGPEDLKSRIQIQPWTKEDPSNGSLFKVLSDNVRFVGARKITGKCASHIDYAKADIFHFKDGSVLTVDQKENLTTYSQTLYPDALAEKNPKQTISGGRVFLTGIVANGGNILGLWKTKETFLVTSYKESDSKPSPDIKLISTTSPIRSIRFIPAVDTRGGSIHALIELNDGLVLAIFSWSDKQK